MLCFTARICNIETQKTFKEYDMKSKPGRKSAAELSVKISALSVRRPAPPKELSSEEKETWESVTATKPSDWFRKDTHPLLVSYCKHVSNVKHVDHLIETFNFDGIKNDFDLWPCLDKLLKARDRESRALVNLARSMRLSQQAMILPRGAGRQMAKTAVGIRMPHESPPWED
jgi:hypothetical protein